MAGVDTAKKIQCGFLKADILIAYYLEFSQGVFTKGKGVMKCHTFSISYIHLGRVYNNC
jgi:hypothetical protein